MSIGAVHLEIKDVTLTSPNNNHHEISTEEKSKVIGNDSDNDDNTKKYSDELQQLYDYRNGLRAQLSSLMDPHILNTSIQRLSSPLSSNHIDDDGPIHHHVDDARRLAPQQGGSGNNEMAQEMLGMNGDSEGNEWRQLSPGHNPWDQPFTPGPLRLCASFGLCIVAPVLIVMDIALIVVLAMSKNIRDGINNEYIECQHLLFTNQVNLALLSSSLIMPFWLAFMNTCTRRGCCRQLCTSLHDHLWPANSLRHYFVLVCQNTSPFSVSSLNCQLLVSSATLLICALVVYADSCVFHSSLRFCSSPII
jgi:hypothetical protein